MSAILIAGTSSDAGKSLVTTGLCRALANRGIDVAPYKAQNMSNNSMVCSDGTEIGRAQYLQAQAARVEATSAMNPVLIKPGTDRRSFTVVRGRPGRVLESGEYATGRPELAKAAWQAFEELQAAHELIVCEGAGSPAEINLREGDYVNMGLARNFDFPVVLVGDIDRGGVLASLFGTWALLDEGDRALLAGYVINKFRGDIDMLKPGLTEITARTGLVNYGILPWLPGVWLDGEDALDLGRWRHEATFGSLKVVAVAFPRISNATDLDALAFEQGVDIAMTQSPQAVLDADLVVLPGTRSTIDDLKWLRSTGLSDAVRERTRRGRPVLGICGGFQMLTGTISDPHGTESGIAAEISGLGLLDVQVTFGPEKVLARPQGTWRGHPVAGYEIHHGRSTVGADAEPFLDGSTDGVAWGTMWHGTLENDAFRRAWLTQIAEQTGSAWRPDPTQGGYGDARESMIDVLADAAEAHLDVTALVDLAR